MDKLAQFLFYPMVVDFSLEMLDFIHRLPEAEESIAILAQMVESRLFTSLIVLRMLLGTILPLLALGLVSPALKPRGFVRPTGESRRLVYLVSGVFVLIGIFSIRWTWSSADNSSPRASKASPSTRWNSWAPKALP